MGQTGFKGINKKTMMGNMGNATSFYNQNMSPALGKTSMMNNNLAMTSKQMGFMKSKKSIMAAPSGKMKMQPSINTINSISAATQKKSVENLNAKENQGKQGEEKKTEKKKNKSLKLFIIQ